MGDKQRVHFDYPRFARDRGAMFWLKPRNWWAARDHLRSDTSNDWRTSIHATEGVDDLSPDHSKDVRELLPRGHGAAYRFLILGDPGEGGRMQYGLLPLIRALAPQFMLINGDVAYPSGRPQDFEAGFFQPYQNLGIPIWATPGNHEYYSREKARPFFQVFCTHTFADHWHKHGLRQVLQPGLFWEIEDPGARLQVIGLDTGMKGDLDGRNQSRGALDQLTWFVGRLGHATAKGNGVIVLFHIPGLVNGKHAKKTHLQQLHAAIARCAEVKMVVCSHEHSFQSYSPAVFGRYLRDYALTEPVAKPAYLVAGASGAFMASTLWAKKRAVKFPCQAVFPKDWPAYMKKTRKAFEAMGLGNSVVAEIAADRNIAWANAADIPDETSLLLVEVDPSAPEPVKVTPVFQKDFSQLYASQPVGKRINVQAGDPPADPVAVDRCLQHNLRVSW